MSGNLKELVGESIGILFMFVVLIQQGNLNFVPFLTMKYPIVKQLTNSVTSYVRCGDFRAFNGT
jgi:hypothetical protein